MLCITQAREVWLPSGNPKLTACLSHLFIHTSNGISFIAPKKLPSNKINPGYERLYNKNKKILIKDIEEDTLKDGNLSHANKLEEHC